MLCMGVFETEIAEDGLPNRPPYFRRGNQMNSRKLSQAADFSGGMTKSACSANDIVAAGRRVHENALFPHSPECSLERFECSTLFTGEVWRRAGCGGFTLLGAVSRFPEKRGRRWRESWD